MELYNQLVKLNSSVAYNTTSRVLTSLIMCGKITSESKVIDVINILHQFEVESVEFYEKNILTVNREDDNGN